MRWGRMIPGFGTIKSFGESAVGPTFSAPLTAGAEVAEALQKYYDALNRPTVFVWEPRDGVGHSSIFIQPPAGGASYTDTVRYASLFPGDDTKTGVEGAGAKHLLPGRKLEGSLSSFAEDCLSEYEDATTPGVRLPEHAITLPNLNVQQMQAAWNVIRTKNDMHYRLMRKNCSTIVARILRAGISNKKHAANIILAHKVWWTPYDIKNLAESLAK